jgi:hypothetical protein
MNRRLGKKEAEALKRKIDAMDAEIASGKRKSLTLEEVHDIEKAVAAGRMKVYSKKEFEKKARI